MLLVHAMTRVRVNAFTISIDGFGAGPDQSLDHPLGVGGARLHQWLSPTATFQKMMGKSGGSVGVDNDLAARAMDNVGAWILGRNMFGPIRGDWPDDDWKGWWGDNPPYHTPVYVLTHYPRDPIEMEGGTTFHFMTEGIESVLDRARKAAQGMDVRIGGGVDVVRQYLRAGLIDEIHLVVSPVLLGSGESLLEGIDLLRLGYGVTDRVAAENGLHVIIERSADVRPAR